MVLAFIVIGLFPGAFAPHDPTEEVGPRLLAPREKPDVEVLVTQSGASIVGLADLAGDRVPFGVVRGTPSSQIARNEASRIEDELRAAGTDARIRLKIERYDTLDQALSALAAGDLVAAGASSNQVEDQIHDYPDLEVVGPIQPTAEVQSFLLGTTQIGQDVFSRVIWGARVALIIGFLAPALSFLVGVPLGLFAGFVGRGFDRGAGTIMDSLYAFPGLILAIAITAVLGPSIVNVVAALAVVYVPTYFRIVRGQTLAVKEELYVEAARSIGARRGEILRRYILPNVIPSAVIIFSVSIADAILIGAGLSFLGLGLPPDVPDWGLDLARGQASIREAWWLVVFPGAMIMLAVLAFTMLGEGLIEIFNPKLRQR